MSKESFECPHFEEHGCPACPYSKLPYAEQLKKKRASVLDAFVGEGFSESKIEKLLAKTKSSPRVEGYRNKAKWMLGWKGKEKIIGVYRPGSHEVIDISKCPVHVAPINSLSGEVLALIKRFRVPLVNKSDRPGLRYMIVRYSEATQKLMLVLVTTKRRVPGLSALVDELKSKPKYRRHLISVVQNINDNPGNALLGENNRFLFRRAELVESFGRFKIPVGPASFVQVNSGQAAYLYRRVRQLLGSGPFYQGLDLYSGIGLMAMHLSRVTERVMAVEELGVAALDAMNAFKSNNANNVLQFCGDALEGIDLFQTEWGDPDWAVINPPRSGCRPEVLEALVKKAPQKFVYVSCNPRSLARDLSKVLLEHPSYVIRTIEPVDMFPQTPHVECITLVEKKTSKDSSSKVLKKKRHGNTRKRRRAVH